MGIVGFGELGQYLAKAILERHAEELELAFVWNRTPSKILESGIPVPSEAILENLDEFKTKGAQVIVEVAHPTITSLYTERFVQAAEFIIGSPTALADAQLEALVQRLGASTSSGEAQVAHGIHIPAGALWGAQDLKRMADRNSLVQLSVTMKKHPHSIKLVPGSSLQAKLDAHFPPTTPSDQLSQEELILYEGPVRDLCPLAPNNVNTMAAAAIAAHTLGFDRTVGRLVADPRLEAHVIEIEAVGPNGFNVKTVRYNPAKTGAVTGQATYASFLSSLLEVARTSALLQHRPRPGIHFC